MDKITKYKPIIEIIDPPVTPTGGNTTNNNLGIFVKDFKVLVDNSQSFPQKGTDWNKVYQDYKNAPGGGAGLLFGLGMAGICYLLACLLY